MREITIGTDGSCSGNPGVGGYAVILQCNGHERLVIRSCVEQTTNNRMELQAVLTALQWVKEKQKKPCKVTIFVDSQYVLSGAHHIVERIRAKDSDTIPDWFKGRPNADLWYQILESFPPQNTVTFKKVTAHSGHELNERCDKLAKEACQRAKEQYQILEATAASVEVPAD